MTSPANTLQSAIEIRNVTFQYNGAPALEDVSVTIDPGDFVSVIGPNGGGKTTLLKLILGLLRPQTGTVRVLGKTPEQARPAIGYVPQYFQFDLEFPVSALDVVLMGRLHRRRLFGGYARDDRAAAQRALEEVGLAESGGRPFAALSGGQRQRALIARALACEPQLLLLDEPTANIDPAVQNDLHGLLTDLNTRMTIVMVTHDIGFVSTNVNRVVCVNRTVILHPTSAITGEMVFGLYGSDVTLVRHDHHCAESGHAPHSPKESR